MIILGSVVVTCSNLVVVDFGRWGLPSQSVALKVQIPKGGSNEDEDDG